MDVVYLIILVTIVAGSLIYLNAYYPHRIRNIDLKVIRPNVDKQCALPKAIRGDICQRNEYRPCSKVGSYEQCTNNVRPANKCICSNQRSFELCPAEFHISDSCYMNEFNRRPDLDMEIKYSDDNSLPRVNRHSVEISPFDILD